MPGVRHGGGTARRATAPRWPGRRFIARRGVDRVVLPDAGDGRWTGAPRDGSARGGNLDRQRSSRGAGLFTTAEDGTISRRKPVAAPIRIHPEMDSLAAPSSGPSTRTDRRIPRCQRRHAGNRRTLRRQLSAVDGSVHPASFFLLLRSADGDFRFPLRDVYVVRLVLRHRPAQSALSDRGGLLPLFDAVPALQFFPTGSTGGGARHARGDE